MLTARLYKGFLAIIQTALLAIMPMAADAQMPAQQAQPPAAMTELSQQGRSLKPDVFAPDRGLVTNSADLLRAQNEARVLHGLQMIKRGLWSSRGTGYSKFHPSQINSGAAILEMGQHYDGAGGYNMLIQSGTSLFHYNISTKTLSGLATFVDTNRCCFRSWNGSTAIICHTSSQPLKWNGNPASVTTGLTGWPCTIGGITYNSPPFVEVFNNRAVFAGFEAQPNTLVLSDFGNPGAYTTSVPALNTDCGAITLPTALGPITGLYSFKLNNDANLPVLVIGCLKGIAILSGSSPIDYSLKEITREYGIMSNRSWIQLGSDLYFFATDGVRRFDSAFASTGLKSVPESYPINDLMALRSPIIIFNAHTSFAVNHPATQEVHWFFDSDGDSSADKVAIMNYSPSAGATQGQFIWSTKSIGATSAIEFTAAGLGIMFHGTNDGYLMLDYSGDTYDGTPISWEFLSPYISANSPAQNASARKFIIMTEGGDQKFTAQAFTLETLSGGQTRFKLQDTASINQVSESITKYGTFASGTTTTYPKLIDFESKGSGRFWAIRLTGSASGEHIDLVGIQSILVVGGWRQ